MFPLGGGFDVVNDENDEYDGGAFGLLGQGQEGGLFGILKNLLGLGGSGQVVQNASGGLGRLMLMPKPMRPQYSGAGLAGASMEGGLFGILKNLLGLGMGEITDEATVRNALNMSNTGGAMFPLGGGADVAELSGMGFFSNLWRKIKSVFRKNKPRITKFATPLIDRAVSTGISHLPEVLRGPASSAVGALRGKIGFGMGEEPLVGGMSGGLFGLLKKLLGGSASAGDKQQIEMNGGLFGLLKKLFGGNLPEEMRRKWGLGPKAIDVIGRAQKRRKRMIGYPPSRRRKLSGGGYSGGGIVDVL